LEVAAEVVEALLALLLVAPIKMQALIGKGIKVYV
jgi:hypothetical protein